jgi:hypothetical protein
VSRAPRHSFKVSAADQFWFHVKQSGLPLPVIEHVFAAPRKWRFDYAWPLYLVAVEIEGLNWKPGGLSRHTTPSGYRADLDKYNTACLLGWSVLRFEQGAVRQGVALDKTERLLTLKGWKR